MGTTTINKYLRIFSEGKESIANRLRKSSSKVGNAHINWCLFKYRHLVDNAFMQIKKYRAIATGYERLERNYASTIALAFTVYQTIDALLIDLCAKVNNL